MAICHAGSGEQSAFLSWVAAYRKNYAIQGSQRGKQTEAELLQAWPMLQQKPAGVIFISRKQYEPQLHNILPNYRVVEARPTFGERLLRIKNPNAPVAFIPQG